MCCWHICCNDVVQSCQHGEESQMAASNTLLNLSLGDPRLFTGQNEAPLNVNTVFLINWVYSAPYAVKHSQLSYKHTQKLSVLTGDEKLSCLCTTQILRSTFKLRTALLKWRMVFGVLVVIWELKVKQFSARGDFHDRSLRYWGEQEIPPGFTSSGWNFIWNHTNVN